MEIVDSAPRMRASRYLLPSARHEGGMWLYWLVQFRWVALVGQAVVLAFTVRVIDTPVWTIPAMIVLMWALLVANHRAFETLERGDRVDQMTLFNHLGLDVIALTGQLLLAGGSDNPFAMLYLVHMALAALVLTQQGAFFMGAAILGAWTLMQFVHLPLHLDRHFLLPADTLLELGRYVALSVTLGSIGFFTVGASNSLKRRERQLREARARLGTPNTEEAPWPEGTFDDA